MSTEVVNIEEDTEEVAVDKDTEAEEEEIEDTDNDDDFINYFFIIYLNLKFQLLHMK